MSYLNVFIFICLKKIHKYLPEMKIKNQIPNIQVKKWPQFGAIREKTRASIETYFLCFMYFYIINLGLLIVIVIP